jgi:hypothetical protein
MRPDQSRAAVAGTAVAREPSVSVERVLVRLWLLAHIAALGPVAAEGIRTSFLQQGPYPLEGPVNVERSLGFPPESIPDSRAPASEPASG